MVADVGANELGLVAQGYATLPKRFLQLLDLLKVAICNTFVGKRPEPF
jgi:hypothetical protein